MIRLGLGIGQGSYFDPLRNLFIAYEECIYYRNKKGGSPA